jgi:heme exporter protein A
MTLSHTSQSPNNSHFRLEARDVSKAFGRRIICRDVRITVTTGESLAVVGPNGSGKSTFVKMLAGLIRPDSGTIQYRAGDVTYKAEQWHQHLSMVSPELALYEELSGYENLEFAGEVLGLTRRRADLDLLLDEIGLHGRGSDLVAAYSSGMKQRLKFALAFLKEPQILLLDEPTVTLDDDGVARVWSALSRRRLALIIATNDSNEAARAQRRIVMGVSSNA